jgi:hypothetical protein
MTDTLHSVSVIDEQTQKAILKESLLDKAIYLYYEIKDDIKLRNRASQEPIESDILEFIKDNNDKIVRQNNLSLFDNEEDMQEFLRHVLLQIANKPDDREEYYQSDLSQLMELVSDYTNSRNGKPEIPPGNIKISLKHLQNDSTGLFEPIPKYLLNDRLKSYVTENEGIFGFLSRSFSSEPVSIFQMLINNENSPYYKKELAQSIYTKPGTRVYKEYPQLGQYQAFSDISNDPDYTFYNGDISNNRLRDTLADFLKAQNTPQPTQNNQSNPVPYIFIGFIKLSPTRFGRIIKSITGVDGHMGCFMINAKTQQIIHFEPKGAFVKISPWQDINLKEEIMDFLETLPGRLDDKSLNTDLVQQLDTYQLVRTTEYTITPKTPQYFDIYCQTYSMYAALFYCLNAITLGERKIDAMFFSSLDKTKAILFQNFFFDFLAPRIKLERKSNKVHELSQNTTKSRSSNVLIRANRQLNSNVREGRFEILKKEKERLESEIAMHAVALAKLQIDYDLKYEERNKIKKERSLKKKALKILLQKDKESREIYNNRSSSLNITALRAEFDRLTKELKTIDDVLNQLYNGKAYYRFSRTDGNNKRTIIDKLIDIGIYELKNLSLKLQDEYDIKMAIYSLYERVPIFSSEKGSMGVFKNKPKFTFKNLGLTEPIRDLLQNSRDARLQRESNAAFNKARIEAMEKRFNKHGLYGTYEDKSITGSNRLELSLGETDSNGSSGSIVSNGSNVSSGSNVSNGSNVSSGSSSSKGSNGSSGSNVSSGSSSSKGSSGSDDSMLTLGGGSRKKYKSKKNVNKKSKPTNTKTKKVKRTNKKMNKKTKTKTNSKN